MPSPTDAGVPQPNNPTSVDPTIIAQSMSDSWGGGVPTDRSFYPPAYFTNPPLKNGHSYNRNADTGLYNFPMADPFLFRGWIQEFPAPSGFSSAYNPPTDPTKVYRCNFHFNPTDVTMDWEVQTPSYDPSQDQNAANQNIGVYQTQGVTFGINLLFDREGDNHPDVLGWGGVNADIRILNAIMTAGQPVGQLTYASPAPVKCVIGRTYSNGGNFGTQSENIQSIQLGGVPVAYPLAVTGFMSSMSVDYQRFNSAMTPTRAVVQLSIQVLTYMPASGTPAPYHVIPPLLVNNSGIYHGGGGLKTT